ncbi:Tn3 family transposase [Microtetraspora malaysiensis]|uniref:Tn3 family transposase n=1 Tax=Microtetraspora malaysiensis TaxID=161358 RepID=UPI003D8FE3B6
MAFRSGVHTGAVRAHDVTRMLSRCGRTTQLGDAIARYDRVSKTLHILRMAGESDSRHQIKAQANLQEERHTLARKIFHGRNGQVYQNYSEGMVDLLAELPGASRRAPGDQRTLTEPSTRTVSLSRKPITPR